LDWKKGVGKVADFFHRLMKIMRLLRTVKPSPFA